MKQTAIGEIPEEWEIKKWVDICEICYGKEQRGVEDKDGLYKIFGTGGPMGNANRFLYNQPSVLIGRKGTIDKPFFVEEPFWTVDTLFYTKIPEFVDPKWFYYVVTSTPLKKYNEATGVPSLSRTNLYQILVGLPPLAEQQKIAEILSTVDEKICVIDEQLAKTTELKTGLMQRLLTKGIGHTDFKDSPLGEIPKEWKVLQLGEVLRLVERPIKMNDDTSYELVTVRRRYGGIAPRGQYLGKDVKVKSQFIVRENDFLISKRQIVHCACGLVPAELDGAIVSNEYSVFNALPYLDLSFFNYYVQRPDIQKSFLLSSDGVHIEKMLFKVRDWVKTLASIPPIAEQRQIAELLTTVDEKLQVLQDKKEHYQTLKRGLMQQLLTGKLRVPVAQDVVAV
ncbi:restriction endonuclease subunit S [Spirosoma fluminis]